MTSGVSNIMHDVEFVVALGGHDLPFLQRQRFSHFAVLNFVGRVVVADPLLRIFVQHHADVVAAIRQDDAGLPVGDDAATDFGGHLIVLPDVCAVVAHGLSPVRRRPPVTECNKGVMAF